MKTLILLRHAKSSWGDPGLGDFDRPLNARGEQAARAIGRELQRQGIGFDRVLASPAARVVGTLAGLEEADSLRVAPVYDHRIYLASPETLIGIVRETDDAHDRLLVVGHNPGLEQLALRLSRAGVLRDRLAAKFPSGALAEIRFDAARWRDVTEGEGTLARFVRPRDLVPEA